MADESQEASTSWTVLPPSPWLLSLVTRLFELATFALMCTWVFHNLGGLGFQPKVVVGPRRGEEYNDTSPVFNWHPLLMTLAFPVFMAEALLAYKVPLAKDLERAQQKLLHAALHTAALVCAIFAVVAAFRSHTMKLPVPIPNLYSPHSYLGLFTFILSLLQYVVGLTAFLYPTLSTKHRGALKPFHVFLGKAVFVLGLTTMAVGIQEKTTFMQDGMKLQGSALFRSYLKIPATLELFLAVVGLLVLYHHAAGQSGRKPVDSSVLFDEELPDSEHS